MSSAKTMATLEQKLDVALWWKQMRETNNARFLPLLFDKHRFLVLKGGGGSGKSIFAGRKILERVTNEPGHRYLVVRKVAKTLRESCFEQLKKQAYEYYADQIAFIHEANTEVRKKELFSKVRTGQVRVLLGSTAKMGAGTNVRATRS